MCAYLLLECKLVLSAQDQVPAGMRGFAAPDIWPKPETIADGVAPDMLFRRIAIL
jgi:hypothetical protein